MRVDYIEKLKTYSEVLKKEEKDNAIEEENIM